eukprot:3227853-Rhodomonas_salina.1
MLYIKDRWNSDRAPVKSGCFFMKRAHSSSAISFCRATIAVRALVRIGGMRAPCSHPFICASAKSSAAMLSQCTQ